jgi:hypothetical protein
MRIPPQLGFALTGSAALAILAGSAASAATVRPMAQFRQPTHAITNVLPPSMQRFVNFNRRPSFSRLPQTGRLPVGPYGFVSDFEGGPNGSGTIYVINVSGTVVAQLAGTEFPQGMQVTNNHNAYGHSPALFVANSGGDNILIYTSLNGTPTALSNGGVEPADVAVDNHGNVAATNIQTGTVSCFTNGSLTATTVTGGNFLEAFFGAFDSSGNFWLDGFNTSGNVAVGEIVGGCAATNPTITAVTTSNTIGFPGGVQVANNGDIAIDDQEGTGSGPVINNYKVSGSSLTLDTQTPLTGAGDPVSITLTPGSHSVLEADAALLNAALYPYPAGGNPSKVITLPGAVLPIGTAIYPSESY